MNKMILTLFLVASIWTSGSFSSAGEVEDKKAPMSFKDFTTHLDLNKNTFLHAKNFWVKTKGKSFIWTGKVVNIKYGRGKVEIYVANEEAPLYKGFNLILMTYRKSNVAALKVGQETKFRGQIYNYKGRRGNPIIVYMKNVKFLPPAEK